MELALSGKTTHRLLLASHLPIRRHNHDEIVMGYKHDLITTYICVFIGYVLLAVYRVELFNSYFQILFFLLVIPGWVIGSTTLLVFMRRRKPKHEANQQGKSRSRSHDPG